MQKNESYFLVLIQTFTRKQLMLLVGVYIAFACAMVGMGASAPRVFSETIQSEAMECTEWNCDTTFRAYLNSLTKLHQVMFLEIQLERPDVDFGSKAGDTTITFPLDVVVSAQGDMETGSKKLTQQERSTGKVQSAQKVDLLVKRKHRRTVTCPPSTKYCNPVVIFAESYLEYPAYHVQVQFLHPFIAAGFFPSTVAAGASATRNAEFDKIKEANRHLPPSLRGKFKMKYINAKFTKFEMKVKYIFFGFSLAFTLLFFRGLVTRVNKGVRGVKNWSYEQKWVAILLPMVCLFDNPFFAAELYHPSLFWTFLAVIFMATFLCLMLLFWLCILDIISSRRYWKDLGDSKRWGGMRFYMPKMALVGCLWVAAIATYVWVRTQQRGDPMYNAPDDMESFTFAKVAGEVLIGITACLLSYYIIMATCQAISSGEWPSPHFLFIFAVTVITLFFSIGGLATGAFSPTPYNTTQFTTFYGVCNLYIWILALAYFPSNVSRDNIRRGRNGNGNGAQTQVNINLAPMTFEGGDWDDDDDDESGDATKTSNPLAQGNGGGSSGGARVVSGPSPTEGMARNPMLRQATGLVDEDGLKNVSLDDPEDGDEV